MEEQLESIRSRLLALETRDSSSVEPVKYKNLDRKQSKYQLHMSNRLKELKTEAESRGSVFNRREAFSQAAREWSENKKN